MSARWDRPGAAPRMKSGRGGLLLSRRAADRPQDEAPKNMYTPVYGGMYVGAQPCAEGISGPGTLPPLRDVRDVAERKWDRGPFRGSPGESQRQVSLGRPSSRREAQGWWASATRLDSRGGLTPYLSTVESDRYNVRPRRGIATQNRTPVCRPRPGRRPARAAKCSPD